jgi:DNA polymerase I-like protein with 3'-5' exonuclease and polymerase domains
MPIPFQQIDQRVFPLYEQLQDRGIPLHRETLETTLVEKQHLLVRLQENINREAGFEVNPNRATDWEKIITNQGGTMKRTPTGAPATDDWAVKSLKDKHPIVLQLSEARKLIRVISQLKNLQNTASSRFKTEGYYGVKPTYKFDPELGRVHSGGEANPMNWPTHLQSIVRHPGRVIVKADYKAMELYVLAKMSGDSHLQFDLQSGDIHSQVAVDIFSTSTPTTDQRRVAKIVTYATIYGGTAVTVAAPVNESRKREAEEKGTPGRFKRMSYSEAENLQQAWRNRYPVAAAFIDHLGESTQQAISWHGRTKVLPPVQGDSDEAVQKSVDTRRRLAINNPIQNSAGDIAKQGFANVFEDPRISQLDGQILTTVHDSIVISFPENTDRQVVDSILKENMEQADPDFNVPVDIKWGLSWGDIN